MKFLLLVSLLTACSGPQQTSSVDAIATPGDPNLPSYYLYAAYKDGIPATPAIGARKCEAGAPGQNCTELWNSELRRPFPGEPGRNPEIWKRLFELYRRQVVTLGQASAEEIRLLKIQHLRDDETLAQLDAQASVAGEAWGRARAEHGAFVPQIQVDEDAVSRLGSQLSGIESQISAIKAALNGNPSNAEALRAQLATYESDKTATGADLANAKTQLEADQGHEQALKIALDDALAVRDSAEAARQTRIDDLNAETPTSDRLVQLTKDLHAVEARQAATAEVLTALLDRGIIYQARAMSTVEQQVVSDLLAIFAPN